MPEIKNTFLQGKMNKDLDERLVPNGQYRDAWNIEVSTSEGSDVGAVKNILGNKRIDNVIPSGFKCVGSIANEKTNKLYWFISSYEKDAIIEHDIINDKVEPVIVDLNASNSRAVLKFSGNIITGINIIDDLLFWTDNNSEPKKINIDTCKEGTPDLDTHTQLLFENGSFDGITISLVSPWSGDDVNHVQYFDGTNTQQKGRYVFAEQKQLRALLGNNATGGTYHNIRHYRNGKFLGVKEIYISSHYGSFNWNDPNWGSPWSEEQKVWELGDIIFGEDVTIDIEERHITVIKPKPLKAPTVKINHTQALDSTSNIPNLFETTFPRFSYRYKYKDGEFSAFAPFTEPVFNPKYTKDINNTNDNIVFYTKDNVYDAKDPHNKAMVNSIHSIELTDFITAQTPEDAIEIEVLYKQENSSVIYSIDTIKQADPEWHTISNHEGKGLQLGTGHHPAHAGGSWYSPGSYTKGKYIVTTENIYAALPANQLLRPWDNIPRKALGQEITGNRIVYGNYLQNYNLGNIKPEIKIGYNDRKNQLGSFENKGLPSIKSQRNYQLGIIYCDKYGRETPVFTSKEGAVNIPWQKTDGTRNASKSLQLNASVPTNFPDWVDSLKFFVKETSSPYYNLVMDRAWVAKSTYELDKGDHLWISFPSSDRNKISEEDYIILKKKIGTGEEQVTFENKFKVIDIKNEAPDAIKYELINMGVSTNVSNVVSVTTGGYFNANQGRPDRENADIILIDRENWMWNAGVGMKGIPLHGTTGGDDPAPEVVDIITKDLYISWKRLSGNAGVESKKYKVQGGRIGTDHYVLKLSTPISKIDADIAHVNGDSSQTTETAFHSDLTLQIEKKQLKDSEDFSGKFFVKISKNQVTGIIEQGSTTSILDDYIISSKAPTWYWEDDKGTSINITSNNYGLSNWNPSYPQTPSAANSIQDGDTGTTHNVQGPSHPLASSGFYNTDDELKLTDYAAAWDGIKTVYGNTFFVDSMYMVAGQSEASNYAKYCCVTWAGCTKGEDGSKEISSWSYPPLKMWLTDWVDSEHVIETPADTQVLTSGPGTGVITAIGAYLGSASITSPAKYYHAIKDGLIETSPVNATDDNFKLFANDSEGVKVTGWVGNSQTVNRHTPQTFATNHINGLEGFVTTNADHAIGPRRWVSGITGSATDHGAGVDTKTYSDDGEVGRHFMHLSFFAPGKDLHDGSWTGTSNLDTYSSMMFGPGSWMANLQGIWGGGVFTGGNSNYPSGHLLAQDRFGAGAIKYAGLAMEGNHDPNTLEWLPETPGPGVGFGYDLKYRELHERQWDPTFTDNGDPDNKIRDFIRNLHPGSQFKFANDTSANPEVYTIKKVVVKKLYNHTSWRAPINRYQSTTMYHSDLEDILYQSVEEAALNWLDTVPDGHAGAVNNGTDALSGRAPWGGGLMGKIKDFGKASNRRLCYIIELDKNPTESTYNPLHTGAGNAMTADIDGGDFVNIEFLEKTQSPLLAGLNKFPAIWEIDPKKQEVDLDIYYEASNNLPIRLNESTNELIAPIGCSVEMVNAGFTDTSILLSWDKNKAVFEPGFPVGDGLNEIDYSGTHFKFTKQDGSFIILTADEQQLLGQSVSSNDFKTSFTFRHDIGDSIQAGLGWHNCFSFGNGLESNRIRDDFNEQFVTNGVKASTITQQIYEEEHRPHGLIYSGVYNSSSGINDLNQFIMAEKITKDLNPTFGSIQKLFQRRISLIAFCEDKVVSITSNKDALYNADGNPQLVATNLVLGDANPFIGEYGISTNPESFASESYRAYFTDKQRGAVIRLSKDGLTPISKAGMHDWFRDNLQNYTSLIGSYDSYKEDYNITLSHKYGENFISNGYLPEGVQLATQAGSLLNYITNQTITEGVPFEYAYEAYNVLNESGPFQWDLNNPSLDTTVTITNHPAIAKDAYQSEITANSVILTAETFDVYTTVTTTYTGMTFGTATQTGTPITTVSGVATSYAGTGTVGTAAAQTTLTPVSYAPATYDETPGSFAGWWYKPIFNMHSGNLFGGDITTHYADNDFRSNISRYVTNIDSQGQGAGGGSVVVETDPYAHQAFQTNPYLVGSAQGQTADWIAGVEKYIAYPVTGNSNSLHVGIVSGTITRKKVGGPYLLYYGQVAGMNNAGGLPGSILFDRPVQDTSSSAYVEFSGIGLNYNDTSTGASIIQPGIQGNGVHSLDDYNNAPGHGPAIINCLHNQFFNGDEVHIQFDLTCYITNKNGAKHEGRHGYNYIKPTITLYDGNNLIGITKIMDVDFSTVNWVGWGNGTMGIGNAFAPHTPTPLAVDDMANANPYTHVWSQRDNVGGFTQDGITSASAYYDGSGASYTATNKNRWIRSGQHIFPDTENITNATTTTNGGGTFSVRCGCSIKFIDPNQQNPDGTPLSSLAGGHITEQKVINDLRIRISNSKAPPATWGVGTNPYYNRLRNPLWEIRNLAVKKGYGVIAPYTEETAGTFTQAVTTLAAGQSATYMPAQPNVPGVDIPAWTEVSHGSLGWFLQSMYGGTNPETQFSAQNSSYYGPEFGKIQITEPLAPGGFYYVPENYNTNPTLGNPNVSYNQYANGAHVVDDNYLQVGPYAQTPAAVDLVWPLSNSWVVGDWYLVDIEYDAAINPNTGMSGSDGLFFVFGARDLGAVNPGSIGSIVGNGPVYHHALAHSQIRTEYGNVDGSGDGKTVIRGIFKIDSNSYIANNVAASASYGTPQDEFRLRMYNFQNESRVTKVIVKKLNVSAVSGTATAWTSSSDILVHSFAKKEVYYKYDKLVWDVPAGSTQWWAQDFGTQLTLSAPQETPGGWKLKFTLGDNQDYHNDGDPNNNFLGSLNGYIFNAIGDAVDGSGGADGIEFSDLQDAGDYEIFFNMDGVAANNYINHKATTATTYSPYPNYTLTPSTQPAISPSVTPNRVSFEASSSSGLRAAISNISLLDQTQIFQGGTSGSWDWDGFDSSSNSYISWDYVGEKLWFGEFSDLDNNGEIDYLYPSAFLNGCPFVDPASTALFKTTINANQWINRTINRYETYEVSFMHGIEQGELDIYYFNSEGYGFRITNIKSSTISDGTPFQVIIGALGDGEGFQGGTTGGTRWRSEKRSASHLAGQQYQPELQETFVITPSAFDENGNDITGTNEVAGWMDNITMTRVYNIEINPETGQDFHEKTVTYNEAVNGWTSFKSFVPESGVSLSKKYFTFDEGKLYRHYVPLKYNWDISEWQDCVIDEAENYNVFYNQVDLFEASILNPFGAPIRRIRTKEFNSSTGDGAESKITFVLNNEPSTVKTFNTLNYEGTQAFVKLPLHQDFLTTDNSKAYQLGIDVEGWNCKEIKSDLSTGTILEFIEKEGKWFNYIKGKQTLKGWQNLDTSRFSVQGIGDVYSVNIN